MTAIAQESLSDCYMQPTTSHTCSALSTPEPRPRTHIAFVNKEKNVQSKTFIYTRASNQSVLVFTSAQLYGLKANEDRIKSFRQHVYQAWQISEMTFKQLAPFTYTLTTKNSGKHSNTLFKLYKEPVTN